MEGKLEDLYRDWSFYINGWWIFFRLFPIELDFTSYISNIMKISFYKLEACIKIKSWWRFNQITTDILISLRKWSESFCLIHRNYISEIFLKEFFEFPCSKFSRFRVIYLKLKIYFCDTFYTEFGLLYCWILVIFQHPMVGKLRKSTWRIIYLQ